MVKFGSHSQAFLNENLGSSLYVIPYCQVRDEFIESSSTETEVGDAEGRFESEWKACLDRAKCDFDQAMAAMWELVFQGISANEEDVRGMSPDRAFQQYLITAGIESSQELLVRVNSIYETSLINAEALRKLVKKFDKKHKAQQSMKLLPKLYSANFIMGQPTLEDLLSLLRRALGIDDSDDDEPDLQPSLRRNYERIRRGQQHDAAVERRKEELTWLKSLVASIAVDEISHIVAHRGFHNPMDLSDIRPLENSLAAFEAAWTSGIHLCECDIALTKDEKLVLAHDANFSRLALDKDSPIYNCQVRDLTFRELISLPLKSGIRPPLLIDVLRSARAIEGDAKVIIEIKPGNNETARALARLFIRHPDLMEQCAAIMSFDVFAMHSLRNDLAVLEQASEVDIAAGALRSGHRSSMSLGNLSLLVDALGNTETPKESGFVPLGHHRDSFDHYGVGLSLSVRETKNNADGPTVMPVPPALPPLSPAASKRSPRVGKYMSPSTGSTRKFLPAEKERKIPKLMLVMVSSKPKVPCELQVSVSDLSKVDQFLHREDGSLDGVFLQFEREMLYTEGTANLRALAAKCTVGVWNHFQKDPDDYETFHHLVREGQVSFVNSDLPKAFRKKQQNRKFLRGVSLEHG